MKFEDRMVIRCHEALMASEKASCDCMSRVPRLEVGKAYRAPESPLALRVTAITFVGEEYCRVFGPTYVISKGYWDAPKEHVLHRQILDKMVEYRI